MNTTTISELLGFVGVGRVETRRGFHKDSKEFIFPLREERDYLKKLTKPMERDSSKMDAEKYE